MITQSRPRQFSFTLLAVLFASCALLFITSLTLATPVKPANTIVVNPGQSIQAAIDSATPGDTIVVNVGTYTENLTLGKAVSLTGVNSATVILNALPSQRVLTVTGATISNSVSISGLTFANGNVTDSGGGVLVTNNALPMVENVIFFNNFAGNSGGGLAVDTFKQITLTNIVAISNTATRGGGGISAGMATIYGGRFVENHSLCTSYPCGGGGIAVTVLTISGTEFVENTAVHSGGGVYASSAVITAAQFMSNYSSYEGGGLWVFANIALADSKFVSNSANSEGGGLYVLPDGFAKITNTEFSHSTAGIGGGASVGSITLNGGRFEANRATDVTYSFDGGGGMNVYCSLDITGTEFMGNSAYHGGGILYYGSCTYGPNTSHIVNSLFVQNMADVGGAALWTMSPSNTQILFTTIASPTLNNVSAIAVATGTVGITNTIIASHVVGIERIAGAVYEDYNLFSGNTQNLSGTISSGTHHPSGSTGFVEPIHNDYHLSSDSTAIDTGADVDVSSDLEGNPRPAKLGFDIGAYEFQYTGPIYKTYLPLIRR
ncbi:MAG TPA: choice-of-anchor Q domain-containing protein [Anaerolineae bacterium]|nr:choice-of-anchor Q domain-containing protein [Anaerolineae bacterium]